MHTQTPWRLYQTSRGIEIGTEHIRAAYWVVCDIAAPQSANAMPNAELIVRAVNAHADAVDIIKAVALHFQDTDSHLGIRANAFLKSL